MNYDRLLIFVVDNKGQNKETAFKRLKYFKARLNSYKINHDDEVTNQVKRYVKIFIYYHKILKS